MKSNTSAVSFVLVLMAASSLVSMISTYKIDQIVHGDLYNYHLEFSYNWAMPYWTMTTIVFAVGWFNIITAIAFQFYVLIYGRKEALKPEISAEPMLQPQPTKEEIIEVETKPTEKVEESKEQATEPAEKVEKEPEEPQPLVEVTPQPEQTETTQAGEAEGQKEQESKPAEESQIETKEPPTTKTETEETSTPTTETEQPRTETGQETPEKSEETPTQVGVPEEEPQTETQAEPQPEPQTAAEETPQQVGTSPL